MNRKAVAEVMGAIRNLDNAWRMILLAQKETAVASTDDVYSYLIEAEDSIMKAAAKLAFELANTEEEKS